MFEELDQAGSAQPCCIQRKVVGETAAAALRDMPEARAHLRVVCRRSAGEATLKLLGRDSTGAGKGGVV